MNALKLRQADLARASMVAPSSVAQWRNGHTKQITGETLLLAALALQCSPRWLATGKGSMTEDGALVTAVARPAGGGKSPKHTELVEECVELLSQLDATSVSDVLSFVRVYAAKKGLTVASTKKSKLKA